MVNNIAELIKKMKDKEMRKIKAGKTSNGAYFVFQSAVREIKTQSSDCYTSYIEEEKKFAYGFIYGLLASHFITSEEAEILTDELSSLYKKFLARAYLRGTLENIAETEKGA